MLWNTVAVVDWWAH